MIKYLCFRMQICRCGGIGRHKGLKIPRPKKRTGSTPVSGTKKRHAGGTARPQLAAWEDGELAGLIRAVGDGATIVFIQDILVAPERQRRGIGTALLRAVLERFNGVRQIELTTDDTPETAAFYRSLGFADFAGLGCRGFMLD